MADDSGSNPAERFFRPRLGDSDAEEPTADDEGGVSLGEAHAPHVPVRRRRHASARALGPGARRRRRRLLITGALSTMVLVVSVCGWAFQGYVLDGIKRVDAFGGLHNRPDTGPKGSMNILLTGVDRREGLSAAEIKKLHLGRADGTRSDTIMLVHLSKAHDRVTVLSLPRDSLVTIPAHTSNGTEGAKGASIPARQGKLNWSYSYGGPDLTVQTVERATGVHIDHYIEINFLGFLKVVDALGGVTVCTPKPIDDPKSGLKLPAGKSHVDGVTALAYSRARYTLTGGSDLGRIKRQQRFMSALMNRALSSSTLTDPVKFTEFLNAALDAVRADKGLSRDTLTALARQLKGLSTDSVTFSTVPLADTGHMVRINGGPAQSTVLWDERAGRVLFREIAHDKPITRPSGTASPSPSGGGLTVTPDDIRVRVINGVGTPGLATRAGHDLREAGFEVSVVPGTRRGAERTVVRYGPARARSAKTLQAAIPGARTKKVASLGERVQVIVGPSWKGAKHVTVAHGGDGRRTTPKTATQNLCPGTRR